MGRWDRATAHTPRSVAGALFCASGTALAVYIASGVSLLITASILIGLAVVVGLVLWHRAGRTDRSELQRLFRVGLVAGAGATAAYDASRYLIIEVLDFGIWPFDTFTLFGRALVGAGYTGWWVTAVGTGYHVVNGIGFGIAYTIWLGRRGPLLGVAWALALEAAMLTLYPTWLEIRSYREFLQMSILGHVAYGLVLGYVARSMLTSPVDDEAERVGVS
jgi:hypothetical protein